MAPSLVFGCAWNIWGGGGPRRCVCCTAPAPENIGGKRPASCTGSRSGLAQPEASAAASRLRASGNGWSPGTAALAPVCPPAPEAAEGKAKKCSRKSSSEPPGGGGGGWPAMASDVGGGDRSFGWLADKRGAKPSAKL
uniref:Uncharacterized protein n=1 Tax=Arundo donax TaxID=35708 RepID=A0A0A9F127_ARUDO